MANQLVSVVSWRDAEHRVSLDSNVRCRSIGATIFARRQAGRQEIDGSVGCVG